MKSTFGFMLLSILAFKVIAFSISCFSPNENALAIEKSTEENKDKEEEACEKNKKKLVLYEFSSLVPQSLISINFLPIKIDSFRIKINVEPPKTVPTPPPNYFS
ncbi:hypothetical protein QWY86_19520 [Pedobacter aquatilis]|uniref:hypothetical protein n=1 Tax=Pedobacter aquatilis TaxID=351343 RepID=UPI0025B47588|nr:hypothetical protein [Pedobacter aquatilis]MDN3588877.1 hypothetical protein [Pedobacter aquatilis]